MKTVDNFNNKLISAFVTAGSILPFMLLPLLHVLTLISAIPSSYPPQASPAPEYPSGNTIPEFPLLQFPYFHRVTPFLFISRERRFTCHNTNFGPAGRS